VAIASDEKELTEARQLKCDVVLRAPGEISRLCEALTKVVEA
jgi:hypothetical protein